MDLSLLDLTPGSVTQVVGASGAGLSTLAARLRDGVPGTAVVTQDALAHVTFLRSTVVEEVAFGLEQRGVDPAVMHERVVRTLGVLGLGELAEENPAHLSGGQTRRLAVATVAVLEPEVLVLDGSFAGLDEDSADALLDLCHNRNHAAVVVLGHRTQPGLDGRILVLRDGRLTDTLPEPPEIHLPAAVTDAVSPSLELGETTAHRGGVRRRWWRPRNRNTPGFTVGPVRLTAVPGRVLWLRGPNGAGKTTLLRALAGLDGHPGAPVETSLLLQRAEDQVVEHPLAELIGDADLTAGMGWDPQAHPLDLPVAQLRLAQAVAVFTRPGPLVLIDEADVGLDDPGRAGFHRLLAQVLAEGRAVIMTCHDSSFISEVARYAGVDVHDLGRRRAGPV